MIRKVIKITAEMSPNVLLARQQIAGGRVPTDEVVIPGVLTWGEYCQRRGLDSQTGQPRPEPNGAWDKVRQCVGLDAEFYEGAEILLFPPSRLEECRRAAAARRVGGDRPGSELGFGGRLTRYMGCDPAEGGDLCAWVIGDRLGLLKVRAEKTPNTAIIPTVTLELMKAFGVDAENVLFDRGGGGKPHGDRLNAMGYPVRSVAFSESVTPPPKRGQGSHIPFAQRQETYEDKTLYTNRRIEMYWEAAGLLDEAASGQGQGYALPVEALDKVALEGRKSLAGQLEIIPKEYKDGRPFLRPKSPKPGQDENDKLPTLIEMIGHSPDEADAFVLMIHAMLHKPKRATAGVV